MKKIVLLALLIVPCILVAQPKNGAKKVLMVLSSYGKDLGKVRPGFEFDEFSQAYLIFKNNGLAIDVASPTGGKVEADEFNKDKAYNKALLSDQSAMDLLDNTIATADVDPSVYDAIYVVGGKGAMFDLPYDPSLQDIILNLYQREGTVISSVCHGPASFVNVKDGENYIVKDIEITAFCNIEEELFGKKWVKEFPFKLEDKLVSRGAIFSQTDFMLSNVAVSGKFVTGQNPFSTTGSAEEVVKALGKEPVARTFYKDEKTVYLVQDMLDGKSTTSWVEQELKNNHETYDMPLMAVYGYYKVLAAKDNVTELAKGVEIIEATVPYFFNEDLQFMLAKTHILLDNKERAKELLEDLDSKNLLKEQVADLLKEIS
ncbi:type 1 glutamine amidotransferase domain-containing protein [Fulvivirga lutimaris]|uniref:type 1 glutamine amidotransferase domain-containing protein n=1 Tax=Fulvivirga lutimaris TaxID=1819566 RepID=UPI0012BD597B|nr:type 1 glutamine amidotransferase domain-containing protein [Fulvivirga lutimaris]MTI39706.1 type 1 glutamine amidotransferase domain-containing protein [Fulvivirga lutimaris]